jgi:hypothetical protein
MVRTCSHVYSSGKTCGRIPRRGETLCRDHRRAHPVEPGLDRSAFEAEMFRECERVALLPLDQVLDAAQEHLVAIYSFMERRTSPRLHAHYTKATIALTNAIDRLLTQPDVLSCLIPGLTPGHAKAIVGIPWVTDPHQGKVCRI